MTEVDFIPGSYSNFIVLSRFENRGNGDSTISYNSSEDFNLVDQDNEELDSKIEIVNGELITPLRYYKEGESYFRFRANKPIDDGIDGRTV